MRASGWFGLTATSTRVAYRWASASHYAGTASYAHHAHGALIKGPNHEGDIVWSSFGNPCASVTLVNGPEIKTCGSEDFTTQHGGRWVIVGGFWYDHHADQNDGSDCPDNCEFVCPGCIDQKWVVP